jgi:hypothetical protein
MTTGKVTGPNSRLLCWLALRRLVLIASAMIVWAR